MATAESTRLVLLSHLAKSTERFCALKMLKILFASGIQAWKWKCPQLCSCTWPGVLFLDNFAWTMGFYWSYMLLPYSSRPFLCALVLKYCHISRINYQIMGGVVCFFFIHFQGLFDTIRTSTTNLPLSDHYGARAELYVGFHRRAVQRLCPTSNTLGRVVPFLNMDDIDQRTQDFCPAEATPWWHQVPIELDLKTARNIISNIVWLLVIGILTNYRYWVPFCL